MNPRHHAPAVSTPSRRRFLQGGLLTGAAALAGPALLSACGSGDIVSALVPSRFFVLGDGLSYLGDPRYTVNDGTTNIWAERVADRYSLDVVQGSTGFAAGYATVAALDAQVTAVLAAATPGANDVYLVNAPMQDVLDAPANTTTASAAGTALAASVRRLITAGAKYVVVAGLYDLGKSPRAIAASAVGSYSASALAYNNAFKTAAADLGATLLFVDLAYYVNQLVDSPYSYGLTDADTPVCSVATANLCTTSTLVSAEYVDYLFADDIHFAPEAHRLFGDYAYEQLRARW